MKAIPASSLALLAAGSLLIHGCAPLLSRVDAVPADAEISIDGHYAGTGATTLPARSLNGYGPARSYRIKLEAPAFKTYEATISSRPEAAMYVGGAASLGAAAYFMAEYLRTGRQEQSFNDEINLAGSMVFAALTYFLTFQNHRFEPAYQFNLASRQVSHPPEPEVAAPISSDPRLKDVVALYEQIRTRYVRKADMQVAEKSSILALFDGSSKQAEPYLERVDPQQPLAAYRQAYLEVSKTQSADTMNRKALQGMLNSLNEPHAAYLPAMPAGNDEAGLGISLAEKNGQLVIVQVLAGSPSEEAGLRQGDRIVAVNGKPLADMSLVERLGWLRGPTDSSVTLSVRRSGKVFTLSAPRSEKRYAPFEAKAVPPGIGYLRLNWLVASLYSRDLEQTLEIGNRTRGLILDLRGTQGGTLTDVKAIGQMILDKGLVARTAGRQPETISVSGKPALAARVPLVVLIDGGTRGAAEVLAGSLQESGRAKLLGETSFGNAYYHAMVPLANGDQIQLPALESLTGAGQRIQGKGLQPEILVAAERTLDAAKDLLINGLSPAEVRRKYELH